VVAIGRLITFATGQAAAHGAAVGHLVLLDITRSGNDRLIEASVDREEGATPSASTSASSTSLGRVLPLSPSAHFCHLSESLLLGVLRDGGQSLQHGRILPLFWGLRRRQVGL
jgi:hypothetical protein